MNRMTPAQLKIWMADGEEIAALDIRRLGPYSRGHLWFAISLPYFQLEHKVRRFVPRPSTRVVLFDDDDGLAERAEVLLKKLGYSNVNCIAGGVAACGEEGFALTDGNYVVQHAFGFFLKDQFNIPLIRADELRDSIEVGVEQVLIDSRPFSEHVQYTIPGSVNIPAAEVPALAPGLINDNCERTVFHCGGITRGVLGAHALMLAGVNTAIVAMDHGTKGWQACGLDTVQGKASAKALERVPLTQTIIDRMAQTYRLDYITAEQLNILQGQGDRTTYVVDVRSPADYRISHPAGSLSIPGEELAGMTNDNLGTINARLCLIGDQESGNAEVTACWMKHLGWEVMIVKDWTVSLSLEHGRDPTLPPDHLAQTATGTCDDFDTVSAIPDGLAGDALLQAHADYNSWRENLYERYKAQKDVRFLTLDEITGQDA